MCCRGRAGACTGGCRTAASPRARARPPCPLLRVSDPEELGIRAVAAVYLQLKPDSGRCPRNVEAVPGAAGDPRLDLARVRKRAFPAGGVPGPAGVALGGA